MCPRSYQISEKSKPAQLQMLKHATASASTPAAALAGPSRTNSMRAEPISVPSLWLNSGRVCAFLTDIRPLSCVATDLITSADWRAKAEQLCPGATASLPGSPKFQVRALCGAVATTPLQQIDANQLPSCEHESKVLLGLKRNRDMLWLWRGVSPIILREHGPLPELHTEPTPPTDLRFEIVAELGLPCGVAQALEAIIEQWSGGGTMRLPECDVACMLQVWIPAPGGSPIVLQPRLPLDAVRYGRRACGGVVGNLDFYNSGVCLAVITHRPEKAAHGVRGPTEAVVSVSCMLEAAQMRSGLRLADVLTKFCNV